MPAWREFLRRVGYLGRRSRFDRELAEEMRFHLESRIEELVQDGVAPDVARQRARREFGSPVRAREDTRAAWQVQWIEDLWRDLRHGARALARSPGFAAVAIGSLGIGVGANAVMFTLVNALLLQPPSVPQPSELVALVSTARESAATPVSYPDFAALRDRSESFQALAAFADVSTGVARAGGQPRVKSGKLVSESFFRTLDARPEQGRLFSAEDHGGNSRVTILSQACWQDAFGGDPGVIGTAARINGIAFTVVGVMPARFTDVDDNLSDDSPDFYVPLRAASLIGPTPDLLENRGERSLIAFGRLKPGVPLARARAEVATIAGTLEKDFPATNRDRSLAVRTVLEYRSGGSGGLAAGALAMTLAAMVLLVACANIAGLLTCRAPVRAREMALRRAIGAGRARLIRQLLAESLLLAVGGGIVGIALGYIPARLGRRLAVEFDPQGAASYPFTTNGRVLAFSLALALLSVVVFGVLPAFHATRADVASVMSGASAATPRRRRWTRLVRGRHLLVTGQVAIAFLLVAITSVVYAGVYRGLVASFRNPGFQVDHLVAVDFDPTTVHFKGPRAGRFFQDLVGRLRDAHEARAVTAEYQDVAVIRPDSPAAREDVRTSGVWIDDGFFDTLEIPIVAGRAIRRADLRTVPTVAVVNDVLARHYWPGHDAVGQRIHLGTGAWVEVIGVVHLNAFMAFGSPPMDTIFLPYGEPSQRNIRLLARSAGDPQALVDPIRKIVRDLDPDQAMPDALSWQSSMNIFLKAALLSLNTLGAMGGLGLLLALVGLYGLIAYEVTSRTREIGIRMALGARAGAVVRMVLRQGLALAVCGVAMGLALTWLLVQAAGTILPGGGSSAVPPEPNGGSQITANFSTDTFGGYAFTLLVLIVLAVTMLSAYLPARRASRVDPTVALRAE